MAQDDSTLVRVSIPEEYDRGRNISVTERARPDYDPLGIRRGSFLIYPKIETGIGVSDNVFLSAIDSQTDAYALFAPSVRVQSDWNSNQLTLSGGGRLRRYFSYPRRDQNEWNFAALGRADVSSDLSVTAEGQVARVQEDPFTGQSDSSVAALSSYRRNFGSLRGEYSAGRIRGILSYDHQDLTFSTIELADGTFVTQRPRDRTINHAAGQLEYAFSPSTSVYGQANYIDTRYGSDLAPGVPNRDSTGVRLISGLSLDVSGQFRGIVGVGYSERNYTSPLYRNVHGFSAEGQIEYFRSELTTFTLKLRRSIEDSNLGIVSAYYDNRVSVRVDHELLTNLLLNAGAEFSRQDYIDAPNKTDIWRLSFGGRYLASSTLGIQPSVTYGNRRSYGVGNDFTISEVAGLISLVIQR